VLATEEIQPYSHKSFPYRRPGRLRRALAGVRDALRFVIHEPLFQFIAIGGTAWLAATYFHTQSQRYVIHIGATERRNLAAAYLQQYQQPATRAQLEELTNHYLTEEVLLREGLALHLDENDEIVRRRIAQKFEFLQTDLTVPQPPSESVLQNWFGRNQTRYMTSPEVTFSQLYFSPDSDGDKVARVRAERTLAELLRGGAKSIGDEGDVFPGPKRGVALTPDATERLFGRSEASQALFIVPVGHWAGPVRSGYGWHLIWVTERRPPELPRFHDVHDRVLADYMDEQHQILRAATIDRLRAKYRIVNDDGP
jgi:peptidyl-prolyl cis-trans isomerase C